MNHSTQWTSETFSGTPGTIHAVDTLSPPSDPYDVILRTREGDKYLAHRIILRLASSAPEVLFGQKEANGITLPMRARTPRFNLSQDSEHSCQCLPTYQVDADGNTLANLLRLLYPNARTPTYFFLSTIHRRAFGAFSLSDSSARRPMDILAVISPVLSLALRLKMLGIVADLCLGILQIANVPGAIEDSQVRDCSLAIYHIACKFHFANIAQKAAYVWLAVPTGDVLSRTLERSSIHPNAFSHRVVPPVLIEYRNQAIAAGLSIFNLCPNGLPTNSVARSSQVEIAVLENITCEACYKQCSSPHLHMGPNNTILRIAAWWCFFKSFAHCYLRTVPRCEWLLSYSVVSMVARIAQNCNICSKTFLFNWQHIQSVIWKQNQAALDLVKLID